MPVPNYGLRKPKTIVFLIPVERCSLGNSQLATNLFYMGARLGLAQGKGNLCLGKFALFMAIILLLTHS